MTNVLSNTQGEQILRLIRAAGPGGVPNHQLAAISLQYNARIFTLRHTRKLDIRKKRIYKRGQPTETYHYYLAGADAPRLVAATIDDLDVETMLAGPFIYRGRPHGDNYFQVGKEYKLKMSKLQVGRPVKILEPLLTNYRDINSFNQEWRKVE
jgi:hypothetical protein